MAECQEDCLSPEFPAAGGKEREEIVQVVLAQMASVAIGPVDSLSNRRTVGLEKDKNTVPTTVMIANQGEGGRADKNRKRKDQHDLKNPSPDPRHPRYWPDKHV